MDSDISVREKGGNYDVVVNIAESKEGSSVELSRVQMNLLTTTPVVTNTAPNNTPAQVSSPSNDPAVSIPGETPAFVADFSAKPPPGPSLRQRTPIQSAYAKPKSRIVEPLYPSISKTKTEGMVQTTPARSPMRSPIASSPIMRSPIASSPNGKVNSSTPKTSAPITPRTPLMAADDDDDEDDDEVYQPENVKIDQRKRGKKLKLLVIIEWTLFVCITAVLVASLTVRRLQDLRIASLELWKWCVLVLVIFCGRLFTEWLTNGVVFLIEKNFLLKKKVLYFVFALKKSVRVVIWLALILLAWALLINRGVQRSEDTSRALNYITRAIVSTLVGSVLWVGKTLIVKIVAASFHVRAYFDRIQESIFHQYILQALSGVPSLVNENSSNIAGHLSFSRVTNGKQEANGEVINVEKLYKIKREKVSAWTMGGLIKVIRSSELPTITDVLDDSAEEESGQQKVISSEVEAREAAYKIFTNVAKPNHKYIDEDDLLQFLPKEEVDNAIPLFEGAAESRRIKRSAFRNWVVKSYNERKCLAVSLSDAKTAIEELNRVSSALVLVVIVIVWLLLMEITTTNVLVFIFSQMLLVVFIFGNTIKTLFEAMIFVFIVHPFDVGDRCVVDGVMMVVDEMNILTTIFLKGDNEKVYYPNAVLATRPVSNFNRSPEMGDAVEFAVDFSTSVESIAALKAKIKAYIDSKPQHWNPNHSVMIREIVDVNKIVMALYVTHTINFQNGERGSRRSDLIFQLKSIFEEIGITYRLLPQEVQISYTGPADTITRR